MSVAFKFCKTRCKATQVHRMALCADCIATNSNVTCGAACGAVTKMNEV